MKICVIGAGYVGIVSAAIFAEWGHNVVCVDKNKDKILQINKGHLPIHEPGLKKLVEQNRHAGRLYFSSDIRDRLSDREIVVIAVGTPPGDDGRPDLSALWEAVESIRALPAGKLIVAVKSTVPVGTCAEISCFLNDIGNDQFEVVAAPEFLRQGSAIHDFLLPDRMIIGCHSEPAKQAMQELYKPLQCPFVFTDWNSAEMIKYAANAFLAMKISYINTIANLCEEIGGDIDQVAFGIGLDRRIGAAFLQPGVGFGGSCLPKDTQAIVALGEDRGVNMALFQEVLHINELQRMRIIDKLEQHLGSLSGKRVAVLGLAFKANTNDVRESPALMIIREITERGGKVAAFDPVVDMQALSGHLSFRPTGNPYEALQGADAAVIVTDWDEFRHLDPVKMRSVMHNPLLIDGRNLFDTAMMKELGIKHTKS